MTDALLQVRNLSVEFKTYGGSVHAVRGVSFDLHRGQTLAIVGESGCGKSVTMQAIAGLIPMPPGRVSSGSVKLNGREILGRWQEEAVLGRKIGMIFQDPMSSLNPTMRVGQQIAETLTIHKGMTKKDALHRAVELLTLTRIPDAEERAQQYPFQFSGGMLQRAMIAVALACDPEILIADEPTTALDVTIQAQILELMLELQERVNTAIILITHDLGVVARLAQRVAVMYAGEIVEQGPVDEIFYRSAHPYTQGLKKAMPTRHLKPGERLSPIEGSPPDLFAPPKGCGYFARCPFAMRVCEQQRPDLIMLADERDHHSRCWLQHADAAIPAGGPYRP